MTNEAKLPKTQFKTLAGVLSLAVLSEDGWVSEYDARLKGGAWVPALAALVSKGLLETTVRPFVMPAGPYAGEIIDETFYSAKEA